MPVELRKLYFLIDFSTSLLCFLYICSLSKSVPKLYLLLKLVHAIIHFMVVYYWVDSPLIKHAVDLADLKYHDKSWPITVNYVVLTMEDIVTHFANAYLLADLIFF